MLKDGRLIPKDGWNLYFYQKLCSMHKFIALFLIVFLVAGAGRLAAQARTASLKGTAWKFYIESLHDSLTMQIGNDSCNTVSSAGEMLVRSLCKQSNDTLRILDFDGQYFCPDGEGVYKISIDGDTMGFSLVSDPCTGRSEALNGIKARKVEMK
jgi:hypothetical protein